MILKLMNGKLAETKCINDETKGGIPMRLLAEFFPEFAEKLDEIDALYQ